jgi:hypothetical protein
MKEPNKMRFLFIAILCLSTMPGCRRSTTEAFHSMPPLPVVRTEDVPPPAAGSVIVDRGTNLRAIAAAAYGHERFSGFVATLNGIPEPEHIAAGITLKTPSLSIAFRDSGLAPEYQPAINALAKACTDYRAAEPAYLAARSASGMTNGTFAIPGDSKATFVRCADAIDAAVAVLRTAKPPHTVPQMTIDQFKKAADQIRELASGSIDGYGYDYDLVGQRFGLAFTNGLIWTRNQHR